MSDIIKPPAKQLHVHNLPDVNSLPLKTLAKCRTCNSWFFVGEVYVGFGFETMWSPVKFWNVRMLWRIAKHG